MYTCYIFNFFMLCVYFSLRCIRYFKSDLNAINLSAFAMKITSRMVLQLVHLSTACVVGHNPTQTPWTGHTTRVQLIVHTQDPMLTTVTMQQVKPLYIHFSKIKTCIFLRIWHPWSSIYAYLKWGIKVNSKRQSRLNKIVCTYCTWFHKKINSLILILSSLPMNILMNVEQNP